MEDNQRLEFNCQLWTRKMLSFEGGLFIFDDITYKQPCTDMKRQRNVV